MRIKQRVFLIFSVRYLSTYIDISAFKTESHTFVKSLPTEEVGFILTTHSLSLEKLKA